MKISRVVNRFRSRLSPLGYKILVKSKKSCQSYYFKCEKKLTIRLSNHQLHPNQEKWDTINIIFNETELTVNGKMVFYEPNHTAKEISRYCFERILLEINLHRKSKRECRCPIK
jgi:hypothetical protein